MRLSRDALDECMDRILAGLDNREWSELESVLTGWARWAFYAKEIAP